MNILQHAVQNAMHNHGERVRSHPTVPLPEEELNPMLESLCSAVMEYSACTGLRMEITSVTDRRPLRRPADYGIALIRTQLALNRLIAAHGFSNTFDETALRVLNTPIAHVDD